MDLKEELLFDTVKENYLYGIGLIVAGLLTLRWLIGYLFLFWGFFTFIVGGVQGNLTKSGQAVQKMKEEEIQSRSSNDSWLGDTEPVKTKSKESEFNFCGNCGNQIKEVGNFCNHCGEKLAN